MIYRIFATALLLAFLVLAPAFAEDLFIKSKEAPALEAEEGKATVHILRLAKAGMAIKFWAYAENQVLGITKGKTCTAALVPAGTHTFWSKGENISAIDLEVAAGGTYYFQQKVRMGGMKARVKMLSLSQAEGEAAISECKNYTTLTEAGAQRGGEIAAQKLKVAKKKAAERQD